MFIYTTLYVRMLYILYIHMFHTYVYVYYTLIDAFACTCKYDNKYNSPLYMHMQMHL